MSLVASQEIIEKLQSLDDELEREQVLDDCIRRIDEAQIEALVGAFKEEVIRNLWADLGHAFRMADGILYIAEQTQNQSQLALGLRMRAQSILIGQGDSKQALPIYDQALQIYNDLGNELGRAETEVTRIWALALIGENEEAVEVGNWALQILASHDEWRTWASCCNNLSYILKRIGRMKESAVLLDDARHVYEQLGVEGEHYLSSNEMNRALILCDLGKFHESIEASQRAEALAQKLENYPQVAQIQHNLGLTYYLWGHYHQALKLFNHAISVWQIESRAREIKLAELGIAYCMLLLRRFNEVLSKTQAVVPYFLEQDILMAAYALLLSAQANIQLQEWEGAYNDLLQAKEVLLDQKNEYLAIEVDMVQANLYFQQGEWNFSRDVALACASSFAQSSFSLEEARAWLAAAKASLRMQEYDQAWNWVSKALDVTASPPSPDMSYEGSRIFGQIALVRGDRTAAIDCYKASIAALEKLQAHTMIEHRADFLQDHEKRATYEDMVLLWLEADQLDQAVVYSERARSRALMNLVEGRINFPVSALAEEDEQIVRTLNRLQEHRNTVYRQQRREHAFSGEVPETDEVDSQEILETENEITHFWHQLLLRSTDYGKEASLSQVHVESIQPYLAANQVLISYFCCNDQFIAFIIPPQGAASIEYVSLPAAPEQINQLLKMLRLNIQSVIKTSNKFLGKITANAQDILHRLYQMLWQPLETCIPEYPEVIIVPYGPLHYLPFHALFDGHSHLLENRGISYLPAASFLKYARQSVCRSEKWLSLGHSCDGRLPHTLSEARTIGSLGKGDIALEDQVTLSLIREHAPEYRVIHFAGHGDFRADNPLFSGLTVADGQLTTLDIFTLNIPASLVTLSACQTGRNIVGGGDELLGLMRAFLAAGTASLVLSHWAVSDEVTARLMECFYQHLAKGVSKGEALRAAQNRVCRSEPDSPSTHPFYWAPFFLIGDSGKL